MGDFDLGAGIKLFSLHRFCMIVQCSAAVIRDCKLCWLLTALSARNVLGAHVPVCLFVSVSPVFPHSFFFRSAYIYPLFFFMQFLHVSIVLHIFRAYLYFCSLQ